MTRLNTEFARLYGAPDSLATDAKTGTHAPADAVKAMVLELARPADWSVLSTVWRAVQSELELPAPAIAISGRDGLQLWFSVVQPVRSSEAADFLAALRQQYLAAIPDSRVGLYPSHTSLAAGNAEPARAVPAVDAHTGHWSAFVSSDLASVFGDEPWLDIPPNRDQQADILSRLSPITLPQWQEALVRLHAARHKVEPLAATVAATLGSVSDMQAQSPKAFLMWVMNDPSVALRDRIEAAKALLPYER